MDSSKGTLTWHRRAKDGIAVDVVKREIDRLDCAIFAKTRWRAPIIATAREYSASRDGPSSPHTTRILFFFARQLHRLKIVPLSCKSLLHSVCGDRLAASPRVIPASTRKGTKSPPQRRSYGPIRALHIWHIHLYSCRLRFAWKLRFS